MCISVQPAAAGDGRTVEGELSMEYGKSREYDIDKEFDSQFDSNIQELLGVLEMLSAGGK